jgi:hypothetical protein
VKSVPSISVSYVRNGSSTKADALGKCGFRWSCSVEARAVGSPRRLCRPPDRTRLLTKSAIAGQTARSTVTVDSFIDLAEPRGC